MAVHVYTAMKNLLFLGLLLVGQCVAFAGGAPRGFMELGELDQAMEKAAASGKLIAVVVKGDDDSCPRCATAVENGTKAIKSDCVMVFSRVSQIRASKTLPEAVAAEAKNTVGGAWVSFFVFDAGLEKLVAKSDRDALESNKEKIKAFKKEVDEARKEASGK